MRVLIRLYGVLAQRAGRDRLEISLPAGATAAAAMEALSPAVPLDGSVRPAVGVEYVAPDRPLNDGDTLHLIPPVGGG